MLYKFLKEKIVRCQIVLFGEIHGTKEIPHLLSEFFEKYAKERNFNVCLEIPSENQRWISAFLLTGQDSYLKEAPFFKHNNRDGRASSEYFNLIKKIYFINLKISKKIEIFCIDTSNFDDYRDQNKREIKIAKNIIKSVSNKVTFAILGNVHASIKELNFNENNIIPAGVYLKKEFGSNLISINLMPKKGRFFNEKLQYMNNIDLEFNKNFDYAYFIENVTPCSFLK